MMYWFVWNDASRKINGVEVGGRALRNGRFFVYASGHPLLRTHWSFWNRLNWLELYLRLGGEDSLASVGLILPRLAYVGVGVGVPRRWLSWWMIEDRVFSAKVGYVSSILRVQIAYAEWAQDCGMTDYYHRQEPKRYSRLQLWPGWNLVLRFPPVLRWLFGKEETESRILDRKAVTIPLDGRQYEGTWELKQWQTRRQRWPWPYRRSLSSELTVTHPPQFAGKGKSSWECGDDGIYGMGSRETTPAGAIGDYIKEVLKNRERYGMPTGRA
jgi:hypothetical protein